MWTIAHRRNKKGSKLLSTLEGPSFLLHSRTNWVLLKYYVSNNNNGGHFEHKSEPSEDVSWPSSAGRVPAGHMAFQIRHVYDDRKIAR